MAIIALLPTFSFAQETEEVDPFADYSYLWESLDKKKDKKKKKKTKEEEVQKEELSASDSLQTIEEPTAVPIDTLISEEEVLADSTIREQEIVADTTIQEEVIPADTTSLDEEPEELDFGKLEEEQVIQDSIKQAKKEAKQEKRKDKKKDEEPTEDFRSGLPPMNSSSAINGGFTYTQIDGKAYVGLVLAPEINLGRVGVGIDVPILYGLDDQKVRTEMFEDGVGALRLIRYVRLGQQKVDPLYVKVGSMSNTMIGYGGLINNYSNSISYEKRKIGIHYDFNVKGLAGMEGLYSDFDPASFNLFAVRPYVRPLSWTIIPIVKSLEIGGSYVTDNDQTELLSSEGISNTFKFTEDGISAWNIDAGLTLLRVPFIQIDLFANYSKLNVSSQALLDSISTMQTAGTIMMPSSKFEDGSGLSVGLNFRFHFIADLLSTDVRIERLNYSNYYLPQFFDTYYEINKDTKILSLASAEKMHGIYGSLTGHVLKKLSLGGSLMIPDQISETAPATVTLNADVDRLFDKFSIHAKYFKGGLTDLEDTFTLDERSLAKVRFVYHLNRFIVTGVDYFYSFTPTEDGYKATQYVSPYFGLSIQF